MRTTLARKAAGVAVVGVLGLGLAACGGSSGGSTDTSGSGSTGSSTSADTKPVASIDSLTGVSTSVDLDPGFLQGLTALKLTPATLGGAKLDGTTLTFPITGGNVTVYKQGAVTPYVQGKIMHDNSGLSLTGGGHTVKLENFVVDPGTSMLTGKVTADDKVVGDSVPLFFLDGRTLQPLSVDQSAGTATLQGTTVSLTKTAADALNGVFGTNALTEYFKVGVAKIVVALPKS